MEEAKKAMKELVKRFLKWLRRILFPIIIALLLILIICSAAVYFLNVFVDGKENDDDWANVPFATSKYIGSTDIEGNGSLTSSIRAKDLWDTMIENNSRVDEYLDGPEELARLMKAEIVTQYPDTRPNPDEEINWEEVFKNPDLLQGIIKFKRADSNNNTSTMTYVEPHILDGWIEEYNTTGNETAKSKALSHFTLRKNAGTNSNNSDVTTSGKMADVSEAIVKEATKMDSYGLSGSVCQTWVGKVYDKAGFGYVPSGCCAYLAGTKWGISSDFSKIVNGAAVWTGHGSYRGTSSCSHASQRGVWTCRYLL